MIHKHEMARIKANAMIGRGQSQLEIVRSLEADYGDDIALLSRGDKEALCFVFDDNTPPVIIAMFDKIKPTNKG